MPSPGLSLVGFIPTQQDALDHLTSACVPATGFNQQALLADWAAAKARLGQRYLMLGTEIWRYPRCSTATRSTDPCAAGLSARPKYLAWRNY